MIPFEDHMDCLKKLNKHEKAHTYYRAKCRRLTIAEVILFCLQDALGTRLAMQQMPNDTVVFTLPSLLKSCGDDDHNLYSSWEHTMPLPSISDIEAMDSIRKALLALFPQTAGKHVPGVTAFSIQHVS
jgi:hypothetical protein